MKARQPDIANRAFSYSPAQDGTRYRRLFRVDFTHDFYVQDEGRCPDFRVIPTTATTSLLASLGLLFKDEGSGFSVFVQPDRVPDIITWLRRGAVATPTGPEFWGQLSFQLLLRNPGFVGITALPMAMRQASTNLYASNRTAHGSSDHAVLPHGRFIGAAAARPVIAREVALKLPKTTATVTVTDIAGTVVIPAPGANPVIVAIATTPPTATLDFADLPNGLYIVNAMDAAGKPVGGRTWPRQLLYVPTTNGALVLLDMLLTQPTPTSTGVYPIPSLFGAVPGPADIDSINYRLPFQARQTSWQYFIVPQSPTSRLVDLAITGPGAHFVQVPGQVLLPDGRQAILFTTDTLLPLRQKSAQHFRLNGQRRDAKGDTNISIHRLPVAPAAPVWPGADHQSMTGTSEMFVYV